MKEALVKAGDSLVVVRRQFSSVPMNYGFSARPADSGEELAGSIEISRKRIFSSPPPETVSLQPDNTVSAGFWDTFVTVTVHAERDLVVSGRRLPGKSLLPVLLIALAVVVIAALIFVLLTR